LCSEKTRVAATVRCVAAAAFSSRNRFMEHSEAGSGTYGSMAVAAELILAGDEQGWYIWTVWGMTKRAVLFEGWMGVGDVACWITVAVDAQLSLVRNQQSRVPRFMPTMAARALLSGSMRMTGGQDVLDLAVTRAT
jgi:hypothetical protein